MPLTQINSIWFISQEKELTEIVNSICKRLGAKDTPHFIRPSRAIAELQGGRLPNLILENLTKNNNEPALPWTLTKQGYFIPVFAISHSLTADNIEQILEAGYIDYAVKPFNESILEHKIRDLYTESYTYDETNALAEIIEQYIGQKNLRSAYKDLLPALARKPKNTNYLVLYALILFEKKKYDLAENIIKKVTKQEPDNLKAKTILTKIFLETKRYEEVDSL